MDLLARTYLSHDTFHREFGVGPRRSCHLSRAENTHEGQLSFYTVSSCDMARDADVSFLHAFL